jgi:hypothetical protein
VSASASATPARNAAPRSPLFDAVRQWNEALLSRDRDAIERVYANTVSFYGQQRTRSQVVTSKLAALEKAPDFNQTLEEVQIEKRDTDSPVVLFEKHWLANGKPGKVRARLSLRREETRWVVAEETDAPTEARFNQASPYSGACQNAVLQLVVTTAEGRAYLMSRGPSSDYPANSARFEAFDWPKPHVAIQENNEGYRVTLAWFQVDLVDLTVTESFSGSRKPLRTQASARAAVKAACKSSRSYPL